ncbi:MAG: hypothetical protein K0R71_1590 [Bacillales bacterium]|jgi:O-antigen/teichoic acid export membrane protein|nr:hypothetical protein [Bacillales bacterium]
MFSEIVKKLKINHSSKSYGKQLSINLIAQIISFAVNIGISLFLTPYIIKTVGSTGYGFVGLANNFIGYAQIITVALNSMAGRFITISIQQNREKDTIQYYSSLVFANALLSSILVIPIVLIIIYIDKLLNVPAHLMWDIKLLWIFIFGGFLISVMGSVFSVSTFAFNRLDLNSKNGILTSAISALILLFAFAFFKPSIWYIGFASFISIIIGLQLNIFYTKALIPYIKIRTKYIDLTKVKELITSGIWNSFTRIAGVLSNGLDLLLSNLLISSFAMGYISISKTIPTFILTLMGTIAGVFAPQMVISYAKDNLESLKEQLLLSVKVLGTISSIPIAILYAYGEQFFSLWVPTLDSHKLMILTIAGSAAFPFVLSLEPLWIVFTITNKVKKSSLYLFFNSILTIGLVLLLLNVFDSEMEKMLVVVGVSSVVGIIRATVFLPVYSAKCLGLKKRFFYPAIIKNLINVILVTLVSFGFRTVFEINSFFEFMGAAVFTSIVGFLISFTVVFKKPERKIVINWIFNKIRFQKNI